MPTNTWLGDAPAVSQIANASIDTVDGTPANNTFTVTIGGLAISQVGDTDVSTTAAALVVLLNLSTDARFSTITWTNPSVGNITGTADTAGVPFVAALTETGAGTGSVTDFSDTTASSGPNHVDTAGNWSLGAVPVDADDVVVENSAVDMLYGLDQSDVELTSLIIRSTFTGTIGLPRTNAGGYVEYRDRYLKISGTDTAINGSGSERINIDFVTDQVSCVVNGSGAAAEEGVPPILLLGSNASNVLTVNKGNVGVAFHAGETATFLTCKVGYITNPSSDATITFGPGTTLGTVTIGGGTTIIGCDVTTVTYTSGTAEIAGVATVTTLNVRSARFYYRSTGTATTINVTGGAAIDFSRDSRSRTVTNANVNLSSGAVIFDPNYTVTWTNGIIPVYV